ncbi:hypothetical protein FB45DRAFT_907611 [Roridomyces roridus]|uniref:Uncharacterized protein n=1 Tax=Roridomyces roridus TaxID=1738132 RepID=A0AAD7FQ25_9AGAR|nr:hypothetical protein FB45DRAFT_907611 [Roridomyces roridus]
MSPNCFETNPDISGLGVRLSFYLQTIALVLLTGRSLEESLNSVWTLLGTSFGLTISALVTAVQNELPLYQAIVVTDLVWLANYAIFMALATYNRHPKGSHTVQYAAIGQTYISMAIILYLWSRAAELEKLQQGAQHIDNTIFVVLFISTPATGKGRTVAIIISSLFLLGYTAVACHFFWNNYPRMLLFRTLSKTASQSQSSSAGKSSPQPSPKRPKSRPKHSSRLPPSLSVDPHLIILGLCFIVPYVVTVGSTELQLKRNPLCSGDSFWGFGQILAMTVTIVPVFITLEAFRKYGFNQRARAAGEHADAASNPSVNHMQLNTLP